MQAGCSAEDNGARHGWCSMRFRFEEEEIGILRAAERLRGSYLSRSTRPDALRGAITLARAGQKLVGVGPDTLVTLAETEAQLLAETARFAAAEVRWLAEQADRPLDRQSAARRDAVGEAFPDLLERGAWRAFGLSRALDAVAARLEGAASGG